MKLPFQSVLVFRTLDSDKKVVSEEILEVSIDLYEVEESTTDEVDISCVEETVERKFLLSRDDKWEVYQKKIADGTGDILVYVRDFT